MADKTKIEWSDATWNVITGCTLVDEGCRNCYAAHLIASWPAIGNHPSRKGLARKNAAGEAKFTGEVRFNEGWLDQPLRWKKPRRIFVCAHGDLFHESVPDEWIDKVFAVMALCPQHTFQVLTKRPERAREYFEGRRRDFGRASNVLGDMAHPCNEDEHEEAVDRLDLFDAMGEPLPNVWLGTSVSDQASADLRIPHLLATPAAVRFISAEPLLGPVDLTRLGNLDSVRSAFPDLWRRLSDHMRPHVINGMQIEALGGRHQATTFYQTPDHMGGFEVGSRYYPRLDWAIVGGESGPNARPMHPDWARSLRDQCVAAGVAFFFKQWGEWTPGENAGEVVTGYRDNATWWDEKWLFGITNMADPEADWDDEPDLYRVGKKSAGRLLDGREWNQMPGDMT